MIAPIIYLAHPTSREYLGQSHADPDPLDEGNWIIPAHAYLDQPPSAVAGKAVVRTADSWAVVTDLRGTVYSTDTGASMRHDELGELPEGLTVEPRPSADHRWSAGEWVLDIEVLLERKHAEKVQEINRGCEATITGGFWSHALGEPHRYNSQIDDQLNLTGMVLRNLHSPYACYDQDDVKDYRPHTAEQLRQVGNDFTDFKLQHLQHANTLKQQLDAAHTAGDLEAMDSLKWESLQP